MKFFGIDKMIDGLKRGAERFGGKVAEKTVKKVERRNGLVPTSPEPYGLGMSGANTEQESRKEVLPPTQAENVKIGIPPAKLRQENKLEFLKKELPLSQDKAEREAIEYEIKQIEKELASMPKGDPDARTQKKSSFANEDSSNLGYQSAQKTTTAERSEYENVEMKSKCRACGFESPEAWTGKCSNCMMSNVSDVGGKSITKDDIIEEHKGLDSFGSEKQNTEETCTECGVDLSSHDHRKDCALSTRSNAGHLTPEAWMSASTDERAVWLELADQDINLATKNWADLSLDSHKKLQDVYDFPVSVNNDVGLMKHFTFRDVNGEEETVEASDENAAWEKLAHDFATPLSELKGMGMKLVRQNKKENAAGMCAICNHDKSNHNDSTNKCSGGSSCLCAGFVSGPISNDGASGDLTEIARHAEGIEHEVEELAEEGLMNTNTSTCPECSGKLRFIGEHEGQSVYQCDGCRGEFREGELLSNKAMSNCACGCKKSDHIPDSRGGFPCPCGCGDCQRLKESYLLENKDISKSEIGEEVEHHIKEKGMKPKQAVAVAYEEAGAARKSSKEDPLDMKNSGLDRGSSKYGSK